MRSILFTLLALLVYMPGNLSAQSYTFQQESLPCLNKKFTIVAHIFKDSLGSYGATEADIKKAVDGINPFFAPICASFEICEFRYHDNFQHDILEDQGTESAQIITQYHADYRINIYFITDFIDPLGHCGFANLNGISQPFSSGIFIKKNCINVRVIAHEMGHFFNLLHTFTGSGAELVDGSNCTTAGDLVCDTPADPFVDGTPQSQWVDQNCVFIYALTDATGNYYNPDLGNIMSYYECGTCGFSWGQLKRMADAYLASAVKFW